MNKTEDETQAETHVEPPKKRKLMPRGRPFTTANAAEMSARGKKVRKMRKEARDRIFLTLVNKLDLGEELIKAIERGDETLVTVIDKAVKMVGLHYDQSEEAATNIRAEVKSDVKMKVAPALNITFSDAEK